MTPTYSIFQPNDAVLYTYVAECRQSLVYRMQYHTLVHDLRGISA
jgi:hypothetical protein